VQFTTSDVQRADARPAFKFYEACLPQDRVHDDVRENSPRIYAVDWQKRSSMQRSLLPSSCLPASDAPHAQYRKPTGIRSTVNLSDPVERSVFSRPWQKRKL